MQRAGQNGRKGKQACAGGRGSCRAAARREACPPKPPDKFRNCASGAGGARPRPRGRPIAANARGGRPGSRDATARSAENGRRSPPRPPARRLGRTPRTAARGRCKVVGGAYSRARARRGLRPLGREPYRTFSFSAWWIVRIGTIATGGPVVAALLGSTLLVISLGGVPAATAQEPEAAEGRVVRRVEIRGLQRISEAYVRRLIKTRAAQPFVRRQEQDRHDEPSPGVRFTSRCALCGSVGGLAWLRPQVEV